MVHYAAVFLNAVSLYAPYNISPHTHTLCPHLMIQSAVKVTYAKNIGFKKELNQRVEAYFKSNQIAKRDNVAMYFKSGIILGWVISARMHCFRIRNCWYWL
jgi:hypothetical protein